MEKLQLEYFMTVAETQNISKAAEALYISQSSLSQTIKRLEKEIGYPLFNRNGKHIILNENGKIFLDAVSRMRNIFDDAMEEIAQVNHVRNREIHINMRCASHFLPQLMTYLEQQVEDTSFRISQQNHDGDKQEEADLMIFAASQKGDHEDSELLLEENILLAVPQNHFLYEKKEIFLTDLLGENFIGLNPAWSLEQALREQCRKRDFEPRVMIQVDNPDILRRLLVTKLGLAFVPEKTWGDTFSNGAFDLRVISDFSMKRYVYLSWKQGFLRNNVRECISLIRTFFQDLSAKKVE